MASLKKNEANVNHDIVSSIWCSGSIFSCGFKGVFIQQCLSFTCSRSHLALFFWFKAEWVQLKAKYWRIKTSLVGLISCMRAEGRRMIFPQSLVISALFIFITLWCEIFVFFSPHVPSEWEKNILKYFSSFVAVKLAKKSEGNHMLTNDCPHFFLPILLQRKMKSTLFCFRFFFVKFSFEMV